MDELYIRQLGEPTITWGEQQRQQRLPKKAQALLYYTALCKGIHARDFLGKMFWSSADAAQAKKNLRNVLPSLRQHLPKTLLISHHTVEFNVTLPHLVDVALFERVLTGNLHQIALPTLHHALQQYQGDFLQQFYVPDAPIFEQWVITQRERLYQLALKGWLVVAHRYWVQQRTDETEAAAARLLQLQPYHEGGHRLLMEIKARNGDMAGAIAQYDRCVTALRREVDVDVSAETSTLYNQIKLGKLPPLPAMGETQSAEISRCLGRDTQLDQLTQLLTQTRHGQGQLALIKGQTGSGKSCLLHTFTEQAILAHSTLISAKTACQQNGTQPYTSVQHLFAQLGLNWPQNTYPTISQLIQLLETMVQRTTLLLVIDDLQWADTASQLLFEQLATRLGSQQIMLIGSYRSHWDVTPVLQAQHSAMIDLDAVWQQDGLRFIDAKLDNEPNTLPFAFRRQFYRFTCGHPAIVVQVWRTLQAQSYVERDSKGAWMLVKDVVWEDLVSAEIEALLTRWVGVLPESLCYLLRAASVEGEEFTADAIGTVCHITSQTLAHQLGELVRRYRLLIEQQPLIINRQRYARYRFQHPLVRHHLYETLTWQERNTFQEALGEAFAELYS
ncbi:MAG: ATP-binding protein [Candidatus Promineifilaceae bacterium]